MKNFKIILIIAILIIFVKNILPTYAASFPSDSIVISDVKKYHGKISKAKVSGSWKLEKESGYLFSNMAKKIVSASTIKENGISKKLIGLAIYIRGSSNDNWIFSRFFVTSSETVGLKQLTQKDVLEQTINQLKTNPSKIFVNLDDIAWVYNVSFSDGFKYEVDKISGDIIYKATIEFERKNIESIPFDGGIYRYKSPLEIYCRQIGNEIKASAFVIGYSEYIKKTSLNEKEYNQLPTLSQKKFIDLYGEKGPI
jgi:hypothetical protein